MDSNHYSTGRAKRSLFHFLSGKVLSAVLGFGTMLLLVRYVAEENFGTYIAVIALLELFYLTTGFGLSTIAQRYVAEYRIKGTSKSLLRFVNQLSVKRLLHSVIIAPFLLLAGNHFLPYIGITLKEELYFWLLALLIISANSSFLEELLGATLQQGIAQGIALLRNSLKFGWIALRIQQGESITIDELIKIECLTTLTSLLIGNFLQKRQIKYSSSSSDAMDNFSVKGMWPVARRFYVVQLLGQTYGPNVIKLLVSRLLGLSQIAAFGFAQSIADMLRNYLPAHLLAGWIRPLMVSRYLLKRDPADLADIANLVMKLNLLGIIPLAAFFTVNGNAFSHWITAGRYPDAGILLVLLCVMVGLQTAHLMFAMITITLEQALANMVATISTALTLPLSYYLVSQFGTTGAACALLLSELVWLLIASILLAKKGFRIHWDILGSLKICTAGLVAAGLTSACKFDAPNFIDLAVSGLILALLFLLFSIYFKPLRDAERSLISGIVPARFVLW